MPDFCLRLPYLVYLSIGSMLFGALIAPVFRDLPNDRETEAPAQGMTMPMDKAAHITRDVPAAFAPAIELSVTEDPMTGWNVALVTRNFDFTPQSAGGPPVPNTGHAHLYVNGRKIARLYGSYYHIPDLPAGQHELTVTLSSNDHAYYAVDGVRIESRVVIVQGE